jgi:hypothetical protein
MDPEPVCKPGDHNNSGTMYQMALVEPLKPTGTKLAMSLICYCRGIVWLIEELNGMKQ